MESRKRKHKENITRQTLNKKSKNEQPASNMIESQLSIINDDVLHDHIATFLDWKALACFAKTHSRMYGLFSKALNNGKLNWYIVNGQKAEAQSQLEHMLAFDTESWHFLLKRQKITEFFGRQWKSVSAIEYVGWSGDKFMLDMLIEHIPDEHKYLALEQLRNVREKGTEHGMPLSFIYDLIDAYSIYNGAPINSSHFEYWNSYFTETIGNLQKTLPMNVLQEYGNGLSNFNEESNRNISVNMDNPERLFSAKVREELGMSFGLLSNHGLIDIEGSRKHSSNTHAISIKDMEGLYSFQKNRLKYLDEMISRLASLPVVKSTLSIC